MGGQLDQCSTTWSNFYSKLYQTLSALVYLYGWFFSFWQGKYLKNEHMLHKMTMHVN